MPETNIMLCVSYTSIKKANSESLHWPACRVTESSRKPAALAWLSDGKPQPCASGKP